MTQKHWLEKEVHVWEKEKIINKSQGQAILSKYGMAKKPAKVHVHEEDKQSKVIGVVAILGVILIGLGFFVFVASNWQEIPAVLKLIILFGTTFLLYFIGWKIGYDTKRFPIIGQALVFLGSIMVGVTIALTAQIFHIQANFPRFFLIWFIAIAPLTYGFKSKPTLLLALILFGCWMASFMSGRSHMFNILEGFFEGFGVFLFYGLTLYGIGYMHEKSVFKDFKSVYQGFGLLFTLAILYAVVVSELEILENAGGHWLSYVFLVTAALTVLGSAFYLGKGLGKVQEFSWNVLALITALGVWIFSLSVENVSYRNLTEGMWAFLIFVYVIFFILIVLTVLSGYYQRKPIFINIGLLFFILYVGYFYFTTVFKYLPKSLALVIGGLILLLGGWYLEKKRRMIIKEIKK